jgi:hypothetical protein
VGLPASRGSRGPTRLQGDRHRRACRSRLAQDRIHGFTAVKDCQGDATHQHDPEQLGATGRESAVAGELPLQIRDRRDLTDVRPPSAANCGVRLSSVLPGHERSRKRLSGRWVSMFVRLARASIRELSVRLRMHRQYPGGADREGAGPRLKSVPDGSLGRRAPPGCILLSAGVAPPSCEFGFRIGPSFDEHHTVPESRPISLGRHPRVDVFDPGHLAGGKGS